MAWTYSDWRSQATAAARRSRLALHLQELEDAIATRSLSIGADGKSLSREGILELIRLRTADYDAMPAQGGSFLKIRRQNG